MKKNCESCGKEFEAKFERARFCGPICNQRERRHERRNVATCVICGEEYPQKERGDCCGPKCRAEYRKKYHIAWKKNMPQSRLQLAGARCTECPSRDAWGRCGALTRGPHQMDPAVSVRLRGLCPRRHGVRDVIDQWCKRRNNLDLPTLDTHRRVVGVPGVYIDEVQVFE
jgi:hypothetical protein